jgi:hypothetical protein
VAGHGVGKRVALSDAGVEVVDDRVEIRVGRLLAEDFERAKQGDAAAEE